MFLCRLLPLLLAAFSLPLLLPAPVAGQGLPSLLFPALRAALSDTYGAADKCSVAVRSGPSYNLCLSLLSASALRLSSDRVCLRLHLQAIFPSFAVVSPCLSSSPPSPEPFACLPVLDGCPSRRECVAQCRADVSCGSLTPESLADFFDSLTAFLPTLSRDDRRTIARYGWLRRVLVNTRRRRRLARFLRNACKLSARRCRYGCRKTLSRCRTNCLSLYTPTLTPSTNASLSPSQSSSTSPSMTMSMTASMSQSLSTTPSASNTLQPSPSPSVSLTASPSHSPSITPSLTSSATSSESPTLSQSVSTSATISMKASLSNTPSPPASKPASLSATPSLSQAPSASSSPSASVTASATATASNSYTPSPTKSKPVSRTPTPSKTPSSTSSPTVSTTASSSHSPSPSGSASVSLTPSISVSASATSTQSASTSASVTLSPSSTASVNQTPSVSLSIGGTPSASTSPSATASPTMSISADVTPSASTSVSVSPTTSPSVTVSSSASMSGDVTPSTSASPSSTSSPSIQITLDTTSTRTPSPSVSSFPSISMSMTGTPSASSLVSAITSPSSSMSTSTTPSSSTSPSATSSPTISISVDVTPSASTSATVSPTTSPSATASPSVSMSTEITSSTSTSPSSTSSPSISITLDVSPTATPSPSVSSSPSTSSSMSGTPSASSSVSATASPSPSMSEEITPSTSTSPSATSSWSISITHDVTPTATTSPSVSSSASPSITENGTPSASSSVSPTVSPSSSMSAYVTPSPSLSISVSSTTSSSPSLKSSPSMSMSTNLTPSASTSASVTPTASASMSADLSPTSFASPSVSSSPSASMSDNVSPSAPMSSSMTSSPSMSADVTSSASNSPSATSTASASMSSNVSPTVSMLPSVTASPSTSMSANETPSASSSASATSSPSASVSAAETQAGIPREPFNDLTAVPGGLDLSSSGDKITTVTGEELPGRYTFTTIAEGIISLDAAANAISSVECSAAGSITVTMKALYVGTTGLALEQMYPIGAVVAVNSDIFGACVLRTFSSETDSTSVNLKDGFLKVASVSGTPAQHTISGEAVSYFDMFSESSFEIDSVEDEASAPAVRKTALRNESFLSTKGLQIQEKALQIPTVERVVHTVTIDNKVTHPLGFDCALNGKLEVDTSSRKIRAKSKAGKKVKISYRIAYSFSFTLEAVISLQPDSWKNEEELIIRYIPAIPILGIGVPIPLGSFFARFPPLRIGFSLDVPFVLSGEVQLNFLLKLPVTLNVKTGRKVVDLSFDNGVETESSSSNTVENSDSVFLFEASPPSPIPQIAAEFSASVLFGIRPAIIFDSPALSAQVRFTAGANAELKTDLLAPFQAISPSSDLFMNDGCADCHQVQLTMQGKVNKLEGVFSLPFYDEDKKIPIPNVLTYSVDFAKFCFVEPINRAQCSASTSTSALPTALQSVSASPSPSSSTTNPSVTVPSSALPSASISPSSSSSSEDPLIVAACTDQPTLREGDGFSGGVKKDRVKGLQLLLNNLDGAGLDTDGLFGSDTKSAVILWQTKKGLSADGIVGPQTWASLCEGLTTNVSPSTSASLAAIPSHSASPSPAGQPPMTGSPSSSPSPQDPLIVAACADEPTLREGDGFSGGVKKDRVKGLQLLLNNLDGAGLDTDGLFGSGTKSAVISWQSKKGLSADGIVGPQTWASLCNAETVPTSPLPPASDVPVTPGIYLELNTPAQTQFRSRKASVRSVIVVHTAETGGGSGPSDNRAENTASFISTRTDYGAYHLIGDTDSIIQLVRFDKAAFHDGTGSNEWSVCISLAIRGEVWPSLDSASKAQLVTTAVQMSVMVATWMQGIGLDVPAPVYLTKAESDQSTASGFISHARRDPDRRSDPGAAFPWTDFLAQYKDRMNL